jgi:hypothetical protein
MMKLQAMEMEAAIVSTATRSRTSPLDGKRGAEGSFKKGKRLEEIFSRGFLLLNRFFAAEVSMDVGQVRKRRMEQQPADRGGREKQNRD